MYESRVDIWTNPTTISADGATNGLDIPLLAEVNGNHKQGTHMRGLVAHVIAYGVVTGTGDGFTVTMKWQVADDSNGSPGTYRDFAQAGVFTMDTDGYFVVNGESKPFLSRLILPTEIPTAAAWARLVATAAGITNGETINLKAFLADAAPSKVDAGKFI